MQSAMWVKTSAFIDLQRHYAPYAVLVGTETNGEANISDMEIYAVSNMWVKISDLTFIDQLLTNCWKPRLIMTEGQQKNRRQEKADKPAIRHRYFQKDEEDEEAKGKSTWEIVREECVVAVLL